MKKLIPLALVLIIGTLSSRVLSWNIASKPIVYGGNPPVNVNIRGHTLYFPAPNNYATLKTYTDPSSKPVEVLKVHARVFYNFGCSEAYVNEHKRKCSGKPGGNNGGIPCATTNDPFFGATFIAPTPLNIAPSHQTYDLITKHIGKQTYYTSSGSVVSKTKFFTEAANFPQTTEPGNFSGNFCYAIPNPTDDPDDD